MPAARTGPTASRRRAWGILILAVVAIAAYAAVLYNFDLTETPSESRFGAGTEVAERLMVYLQPVSVDPLNQTMQVKVDLQPAPGLAGNRPGYPSRNLAVSLVSNDTTVQREFRANQPIPQFTIDPDLTEGSVVDYPLDRYIVDLRIKAIEEPEHDTGASVPIAQGITVWEGLLGYRFYATMLPDNEPGETHLRFELRHTAAQIFFAFALYAAMVVLACASLAIASLIFLGRRRPEATLVGALAALVFVVPTLRNMMPLAPPLGVRADIAVFLWAELAAVIGVALLVWRWVRPVAE